MEKKCIACGMPMREESDFAMGDQDKDYCKHCVNSDGSMHSYEQKLESLTGFIIQAHGFDEEKARTTATDMMSKLPAWQ